MAVLKAKDASKLDQKSRSDKIKELKFELVKSQTGTQKSGGKKKEIKRAIARLLTFNSAKKAKEKNK